MSVEHPLDWKALPQRDESLLSRARHQGRRERYNSSTSANRLSSVISSNSSSMDRISDEPAGVAEATTAPPTMAKGSSDRLAQKESQQAKLLDSDTIDANNDHPSRTKNRPGYNSYLKVVLDDTTVQQLHHMALRLQDHIAHHFVNEVATTNVDQNETIMKNANRDDRDPHQKDPSGDKEAVDPSGIGCDDRNNHMTKPTNLLNRQSQGREGRKLSRLLRLKVRSLDSLHMTLFFGGETLCALLEAELLQWYHQVKQRLELSGFIAQSGPERKVTYLIQENSMATHPGSEQIKYPIVLPTEQVATPPCPAMPSATIDKARTAADPYWFRVVELCLFPPQRKNLIVALLETGPAWHALHDDLRDLAQQSDCVALRDLTKFSKARWTAHITLGNLVGGSKADLRTVGNWLRDPLFYQSLIDLSVPQGQQSAAGKPSTTDHDYTATPLALYPAKTKKISMGGPIPPQVELNWDFEYSGMSESPTGSNK